MEYVPFQNIVDQIELNEGDICLLASDITKLAFTTARKEGSFDVNQFIESFQNKIGITGTLLIPSFNYHLRNGDSFDILNTKPITGSLSIAAFLRKDFLRTTHPLHSFMVWGKYQKELCSLENESSFGNNSPFGFLHQKKAKMVFISTGVTEALTFTHYVEEKEKVKYRYFKNIEINYKNNLGESYNKKIKLYAKRIGWTMNLDKLEMKMLNGVLDQKVINGLNIQFLSLNKAFDYIQKDIRENKARSISGFSLKIYFKESLKYILSTLNLYKTTFEKIQHASNIF